MRILHTYLTRQVMASVLMTVGVFTFVLLLGNVLREVLALLVNRQANLWTVTSAIGLLIPFVLAFALPMGLLTGTLLVFGRFSADHELTAVRAGGASLVALISPLLLLSVALSCVCAIVNMELAPRCRVAYKRLLFNVGMRTAGSMITEKTFIKDFPGRMIYIGKVDDSDLKDVLIFNLEGERVESYLRAARGRYVVDTTNNTIQVTLWDTFRVSTAGGKRRADWVGELELAPVPVMKPSEEAPKLSDMTFLQLRKELRDLERRVGQALPLTRGGTNAPPANRRGHSLRSEDLTTPAKVQMHRQVAFSFACIGFTLVGIPLGIRAHRRETTFGIAVALILVTLYYSFFTLGAALETHPEWSPHLILWLPNFIFQAIGMVLLWRANRGF